MFSVVSNCKSIETFQMTINKKIDKLYCSSTMKYISKNKIRDSYFYMDQSHNENASCNKCIQYNSIYQKF